MEIPTYFWARVHGDKPWHFAGLVDRAKRRWGPHLITHCGIRLEEFRDREYVMVTEPWKLQGRICSRCQRHWDAKVGPPF
jgi:hypothetical protein